MLDRARVREVYAEAAELPEDRRATYLDHACTGQAELRAEVESLLAAASQQPMFLRSPTVALASEPARECGSRIGAYRVLQEIGQGGFGSVYMAEQEQPVRRRVALKIIKLGMDTRAVIARFEAERQALALMDHPHIARVLDAGATETGRPYFVMELVRGDPITVYCDRNSLDVSGRLDLFLQVCAAVQHAHSKGVIHRDIKPSNVLVATQDGRPHAKVIDFGIAKATEQRLTEKTLFTEFHQLIGTPEYMSPEQVEGSLDIDTRSDVYSLGVLLYELLTGATPFDSKTLRAAAYAEVQRIIREVEPPKPSTRLSQSATLRHVAAQRGTEPARLSALVRGDLDWVVMKALEKDRSRRYETPSALAADVRRHLAGEAVAAVPPTAGYRLRKIIRRNRVLVGGAGVVAGALLVGVGGLGVGLLRANQARAEEKRQREVAEASGLLAAAEARRATEAEEKAQSRAADLERVARFQAAQLQGIDPQLMGARLREDLLEEGRASLSRTEPDEGARAQRLRQFSDELAAANLTNVALRTLERNIFDRAIETIDQEFAEQPLVRARLLLTIGETLRSLGLHGRALDPQTRALELFRGSLGEEHPETLAARSALGQSLLDWGHVPEAAAHIGAALEAQTRLLGEDHPDRLATMGNFAQVLLKEGKPAEAEACNREVLERRVRTLGESHPDSITALNNLASSLAMQGRLAEAEPLLRRGLDLNRRVRGEDHPSTLTWLNNLAEMLEAQGKLDDAARARDRLLETSRRVLGDDHPDLLPILNNMGVSLVRRNRLAEAEPLLREALASMRRVLGAAHGDTLMAANNLGHVLRVQGKIDESAEVLGQAAADSAGFPLAMPQSRAMLLHHYADALRLVDRLDEARAAALESAEMYRANPDWNPQEALHAEVVLREVHAARAEHAEAEVISRAIVDRARAAQPADEAGLAAALAALGLNLLDLGRHADAEAALREALEIRSRIFADDHPAVWLRYNCMSLLGAAIAGQAADDSAEPPARLARLREAEPLVLEGYRGLKDDPRVPAPAGAAGPDRRREALLRIVALYEAWDCLEPGQGYSAKADAWRGESPDAHGG